MKFSRWQFAVLLLALGVTQTSWAAAKTFYLHHGDRVLFYGDSITEQRYYPVAIETYVRTRFPDLNVRFVDSAVGGARVTGNWATSSEAQSLERDVFPFKPNIVTIMLGMNDAMYRPFNQSIFNTYVKGYEYIVNSLQQHLPGVKIVLIEPSPWDDVTHAPLYPHNPHHVPGGYNDTLVRYSQFVRKFGAEHHFMVVNFNTPIVKLLRQAEHENPALAQKLIPGRIHPGASTQLFMAQLLLKAWNAPSTVTRVSLNAKSGTVSQSVNTDVTGFSASGKDIAWTQTDKALPYPIMSLHSTHWPQFPPDPFHAYPPRIFWKLPPLEGPTINPVAKLVVDLTQMYQNLDAEMLKVDGLTGASYTLKIDGTPVGTFSKEQLAEGINLARYQTPMMDQADKVLTEVWHQEDIRFYGWRGIQVPLRKDTAPGIQSAVDQMLAALNKQQDGMVAREHALAQPKAHHYELQLQ